MQRGGIQFYHPRGNQCSEFFSSLMRGFRQYSVHHFFCVGHKIIIDTSVYDFILVFFFLLYWKVYLCLQQVSCMFPLPPLYNKTGNVLTCGIFSISYKLSFSHFLEIIILRDSKSRLIARSRSVFLLHFVSLTRHDHE